MIDSKTLDSSIWIAYFVNEDYKEEIENEQQIDGVYSTKVDGKKIKADTFYKVVAGVFMEVK